MTDVVLTLMYAIEFGRPEIEAIKSLAVVESNAEADEPDPSIDPTFLDFELDYHSLDTVLETLKVIIPSGAGAVAATKVLRDVIVEYIKSKNAFIEVERGGHKVTINASMGKDEIADVIQKLTADAGKK